MTDTTIVQIAKLADIKLTDAEAITIGAAFADTYKVVAELKELDTAGVPATYQVTGLENVTRPDEIDEERMFTQSQALANASRVHQGYFVVPRVIDREA